jgi:rfaE bifunctional protein nucleotidyltransferase chain/domain
MTTEKIATSIDELASTLDAGRNSNGKIVMCHGVFDLIHPGHIMHLQAAHELGDTLVVSLTSDQFVNKGPWRPVFNERIRARTIASLETVDHVVINDNPTAIEVIKRLRPDIYVKGEDYESPDEDLTGKITEEQEAVESVGGKIEFTHEQTFSASTLINQFFAPYPDGTQNYLETLRHSYSADDVIERLQRLSDVRPLVVGEVIIDEYCYVEPLAKAPRESIIAAKYDSMEQFAGGAASTANHLAGFCEEVTLVASIGPDPEERKLIENMLAPNIRFEPIITSDRGTVVKRRFLDKSHLTKLFEIQFVDDSELAEEDERRSANLLSELVASHDLVVVNDFGHGFLTPRLKSLLSEKSPFLALNTQTNSANLGFNQITHYPRADYACIDFTEARLAAEKKYGGAVECGSHLISKLGAKSFMVTMGTHGAAYVLNNGEMYETPALSPSVVDRVGAGDAFFAITSPWVYRGQPDDLTGFIGNCVGALQVGRVGNRVPVAPVELFKFVTSLLK